MDPVYLDYSATTPVDSRVAKVVVRFMAEEFGNAGSRSHEFGLRAKEAVQRAREQIAAVVDAKPEEVTFTSGATESNNLAILGLAPFGETNHKRHIVSTPIEHKAVLEPLDVLKRRGFEVTLVPPGSDGRVAPSDVLSEIRSDTLLVSVMHANNETGTIQPLREIADLLSNHDCFFHVDAAQGFAKDLEALRHQRIDLISISGHKIFAPKGIGALIGRIRGFRRPPLEPLFFGGGQERGLRPGTLPTQLAVGLGLAAQIAIEEYAVRREACLKIRKEALTHLQSLGLSINGSVGASLPHVLNVSIPGADSEAVMLSLKGIVAISNGSACTSASYRPSHVLTAMGLSPERVQGAVRLSWSHMTPLVDWPVVIDRLRHLTGDGYAIAENI
jgi:cysteine desulfurase